MKEYETTKKIEEELKKLNIEYKTCEDEKGLVAHIVIGKPRKTLAIRCEIDALKITEQNEITYKSKNNGVMHACGHDANMAIALGVCKRLSIIKNELENKYDFLQNDEKYPKNIEIYIIFQPEEEIAKGALKMIKFDKWYDKVDAIISLHVVNDIENEYFYLKKENLLCGCEKFFIDINKWYNKNYDVYKNNSHNLRYEIINKIKNICKIRNIILKKNNNKFKISKKKFIKYNLENYLTSNYKKIDIIKAQKNVNKNDLKIIISKRHKNINNIVGYINYFEEKKLDKLKRDLKILLKKYEINIEFENFTYPVKNSNKLYYIAKDVVKNLNMKKVSSYNALGEDDFGHYLKGKNLDGLYVFFGTKDIERKNFRRHSPRFDIDDNNLEIAVNFYIEFIKEYVES